MSLNLRIAEVIQNHTLAPCKAAAASNIVLAGLQTVSGVELVAGDRCLVTAQTAASENGIYTVVGGSWSRATDFNAGSDVTTGAIVSTTESQEIWQVSFAGTFSAGTTELVWVRQAAPARTPSPATDFSDATSALNAANKYAGLSVFDSTNNRLMVASGGAATSPWYVSDGSASVTPA